MSTREMPLERPALPQEPLRPHEEDDDSDQAEEFPSFNSDSLRTFRESNRSIEHVLATKTSPAQLPSMKRRTRTHSELPAANSTMEPKKYIIHYQVGRGGWVWSKAVPDTSIGAFLMEHTFFNTEKNLDWIEVLQLPGGDQSHQGVQIENLTRHIKSLPEKEGADVWLVVLDLENRY